jgi:hypothetical protein
MEKKYDVWVILEEREGADQVEIIETAYMGTCRAEDAGRELFDAVQTVGLAASTIVEGTTKLIRDYH